MIPSIETNSDSEMKTDPMNPRDEIKTIDLNYYRKLVRTYIDLRRYKTALYWAEKVAILREYDAKDVYWLAQCMFLLKEYHRAAHVIKTRGLEETNIFCHYLVVESLYEAKEYQAALDLLNSINLEHLTEMVKSWNGSNEIEYDATMNILTCVDLDESGPSKSEILASLCLLKGKILEALDNRILAMNCYVEALHLSVYCTEEKELISHLPFDVQCTDSEAKVIRRLYEGKMKKYHDSPLMIDNNPQSAIPNLANSKTIQHILQTIQKMNIDGANVELRKSTQDNNLKMNTSTHKNIASPYSTKYLPERFSSPYQMTPYHINKSGNSRNVSVSDFKGNARIRDEKSIRLNMVMDRLEHSTDMTIKMAEVLFYSSEFTKCVRILEQILKEDPYHCSALIILVGCLVELKEHSKLFCIAHKLVDLYSDRAIAWYAVGCYYDLIGKSDPARRYFTKATTIDRFFGPAWLAYGHSFARENEHDQAMAAYFKATQLMRGCHLPLLYIGVECGLTKNLDLSEKFFYQAMSIAPLDIFVLYELGVIKFEYEQYEAAEEILRTTLAIVTETTQGGKDEIHIRWEPLFNNLGHCCRKNKKYDEAIRFHQQALVLKPQNSNTYTAIAFIHALRGNLDTAISYLHRSLALRRDDVVTTELLKSCVIELMASDNVMDSLDKEDFD